jgi:hypothetical protein
MPSLIRESGKSQPIGELVLDHYLIKHRVTMIDATSAYDVKTFRHRCN